MYWLSPWEKALDIVARNLFWKAYRKKDLPKKIEIEMELKIFEQDQSLFIRLIEFCQNIGWESAEFKKSEERSIFLVLKRAQKRCSSG
ncbi:MAG: hypothetical protein WC831_02080 [Parcubacteria group bacterium]|jgi:hypothetical protein